MYTGQRHSAIAGVAVLTAAAPALGAWGAPGRASRGPAPAHSPDLAINATGDAVAVWVAGTRLRERIVVSVRPAGGRWRPPQIVSGSGRRAIDPPVTVDANGRLLAVWPQAVRTRTLRVRGGPRRQAVSVGPARHNRLNARR